MLRLFPSHYDFFHVLGRRSSRARFLACNMTSASRWPSRVLGGAVSVLHGLPSFCFTFCHRTLLHILSSSSSFCFHFSEFWRYFAGALEHYGLRKSHRPHSNDLLICVEILPKNVGTRKNKISPNLKRTTQLGNLHTIFEKFSDPNKSAVTGRICFSGCGVQLSLGNLWHGTDVTVAEAIGYGVHGPCIDSRLEKRYGHWYTKSQSVRMCQEIVQNVPNMQDMQAL